jgi:hypothetical protein
MTQTNVASILDIATLQGMMHHGATLPAFHLGSYATGAMCTENIRAYCTIIMPYELARTALSQAPCLWMEDTT